MKKYIANTAIGISVTLPNGKTARISFSVMTDGTSIFYTDDKDLQWALEHHYKFGKLFRLARVQNQSPAIPKKDVAKNSSKNSSKKASTKSNKKVAKEIKKIDQNPEEPEESPEVVDNEEEESTEDQTPEIREVEVSDMDAAKDYLAEHFDVIRTKMKTEENIRETALSFGIEFKYL